MAAEQPDDRSASADDEAILYDQSEEIPQEVTWAEGPEVLTVSVEYTNDEGAAPSVSARRTGPPRLENDFQALLTGLLIGSVMRESSMFTGGLKIDVTRNEDDIYNPWFTVATQSGQRAVVTVTSLT